MTCSETEKLIIKWKTTYERYLAASGVAENQRENIWVEISQLVIERWKNDLAFRTMHRNDFVSVISHMIDEYSKLIEYYDRFGYVVPETKNTGGRWLP